MFHASLGDILTTALKGIMRTRNGEGLTMVKPRDWLLLLVDEQIDPIRIQKAMFLFAKDATPPKKQTYDFVPYNWGPCSFDIYSDLDQLRQDGLLERVPVQGASWYKYRRTKNGEAEANRLARRVDPDLLKSLKRISASISAKSFNALLSHVYRKYPEFAAKSLFRG